ncbi:TetR/AcrR family transcriptional regulator [Neptuniibacter sp.]|uniref:TetR/AcrR family transcriptional regulator n=1 Tax=Neptuniibacter sp. TaxID=1962643 RepID=UPI00260DA527|nr:TetR/AcrR family transcriptional regulator [Neptuniibacter sp.]MCP4596753.1 TetR/AcrR family transcriptional regulator [Neptuniibacter sp.]
MCPNGNADLTRSLILNSAIQIISKDGLSALTAGRLIEQADISKGGLYHHFRTMKEVEAEVLERLLHNLSLQISAYSKPESKSDFLDLIEKELFECFIVGTDSSRALFAFLSEAVNNNTVQVMLRRMMDDISLQRLQQLMAVSTGVTHATLHNTVQIISTMQMGLMTRYFIAEDITSLKNYWKGCRGVLEELLGMTEQVVLEDNVAEFPISSERANLSRL